METLGNGMMALYEACQANLAECHRENVMLQWGMYSLMALLFGIGVLAVYAMWENRNTTFSIPPPPPPMSFDEFMASQKGK